MKKVVCLLVLMLLVTGCGKKESVVQKKKVNNRLLRCEATKKEDGIIYSSRYNFVKGASIAGVIQIDRSLEEKNYSDEAFKALSEVSICSSDYFGELINYGECNTEVEDKKIISKVILDVNLTKDANMSLESLNKELSNKGLKCSLK